MEHAVIFVPHIPDAARWINLCCVHCAAHGYLLTAVVHGWRDVQQYVHGGIADVVVAAAREHVPRDRRPRLEFAGEPFGMPTEEQLRRPHRIGEGY